MRFAAADHCTVILRNGDPMQMESLCDVILTYEDRIVFAELKDAKYRGVFGEAAAQLENTIRLFAENHDLMAYKKRRAFVCSKAKPNFPYQLTDQMAAFKRRNNVILTSNTTIKIN